MTKEEAIQQMKKGSKFSHQFFNDKEWITINSKGQYEMEDGATIDEKTFWADRPHNNWNTGWWRVDEPKKEVIPAPVYKHTDGDWIAQNNEVYTIDKSICFCNKSSSNITKEEGDANAAYIVKCVNSFPALVEALQGFMWYAEHECVYDKMAKFGDPYYKAKEVLKNAAQ